LGLPSGPIRLLNGAIKLIVRSGEALEKRENLTGDLLSHPSHGAITKVPLFVALDLRD